MPTLNCSVATKRANKATESDISNLFGETGTQVVRHPKSLTQLQRDDIWRIYEDNVYDLTKNSSLGWNPSKKRKEMFHSLSRFILIYDPEEVLLAFVIFRFEHEYDEDILYCYEAQVAAAAQRQGLGKRLFIDLEKIGKAFDMEKIMLTVLKSNPKAKSFYESLGFQVDPSSPDEVQVDYEILSKVLLNIVNP